MSKRASLYFSVLVPDDTNVDALAESVFDFLCSDPENLFSSIEEVESYDYQVEDQA